MKFSKNLKHLLLTLTLACTSTIYVQAAPYTVKSGDSLYNLSKTFKTSTDALMKDNNLSNSNIYIGQILQVPGSTYTVKSGDSLYLISKKYGISVDVLKSVNNRLGDLIYTGEILLIPSQSIAGQPSSVVGVIPYTTNDVDILARLITAEAGGESYNAMVSVGAVVVNRVKSSDFPNTITGVIYDKPYGYYQFTPVANGMINKPASSLAVKAAYDALKGVDPTGGALYFYDNTATNAWLRSKPVALNTGGLTFAY